MRALLTWDVSDIEPLKDVVQFHPNVRLIAGSEPQLRVRLLTANTQLPFELPGGIEPLRFTADAMASHPFWDELSTDDRWRQPGATATYRQSGNVWRLLVAGDPAAAMPLYQGIIDRQCLPERLASHL